ncbi:MAG: CARDB domain-containing protein [Chloroflexota bacterium]
MRRLAILCSFLLLLLSLLLPRPFSSLFSLSEHNISTLYAQEDEEEPAYVPGQLIIGFKPGITKQQISDFYAEFGLSEKDDLDSNLDDDNPEQKLASVPEVNDALIETVENDERVKYAEPNYLLHLNKTPTDPEWDKLWGLNNTGQTGGTPGADISAINAWDVSTGSKDIVVAVIDTGIDWEHEDLAANIWVNPTECPQGHGKCKADGEDNDKNGYADDFYGVNTISNDGNVMDDFGHGTHVAGTIGAVGNNRKGIVGVNWNVKIVGCKFLSAFGSGTTSNAIKCFNYLTHLKEKQGVNLVLTNNSWGGGLRSEALREAMSGEKAPLHVCAAGNANTNRLAYPAGYDLPNILAVAATDHNDQYASFSNYGSWVDLAAPGVAVYSTVPDERCSLCDPSGYRNANGTSMATPHVAGAAALIWSKFSDLTVPQVIQRIISGADPIADRQKTTATNTRLNLENAMEDDSTPPAAVSDLAASGVLLTRVNLSWSATGDDGLQGTANAYDIRYSASPISEGSWEKATPVLGVDAPKPQGMKETITVGGLMPDTTYYFALQVHDNVGNPSALSNVIVVKTSAGTIAFSDNLESGSGNWVVDSEESLWHLSNLRYNSPVTAWYYGQEEDRNYDTGEANHGTITSNAIDLAGADDALLTFYEWSEVQRTESSDRTRVQVSADGEAWTTVFESHGTDDEWVHRSVSLADFVTQTHTIHVRFWFDTITDRLNEHEGWFVDDIQVLTAKLTEPGEVVDTPNLLMQPTNIGFNPAKPTEGNLVTVNAVILNNGTGDAADVLVQFVDVTDGVRPIGPQQAIASIPSGGSGVAQISYSTEGLAGDREIQVMVDPNNFIVELNEADNKASRTLSIAHKAEPNLAIEATNIGFDPANPSQGDQVTVFATVLNTGDASAADVMVQFIDDTDSIGRPIGEPQIINQISAGGSGSVQITYDTAGSEENRKIEIVVDPNNTIIESNERDNSASKILEMVKSPAPNLVADKDNIGFNPANPIAGDTVMLNATIRNAGTEDASDVQVQFVDSTNNGAVPIGIQQTIELIPAGGSGLVQVEYDTAGKIGDRKIEVIIDPHNFLAESKETDNKATATLEVHPSVMPNLTVQRANIGFSPAKPTRGDVINITATILNNGTDEATDIVVQFFDVTNGGSRPIGQREIIGSIAAGSAEKAEVTYQTSSLSGERQIQVVVDPSNFIQESDETDNLARTSISLRTQAAPNLVMLANNIKFNPPVPMNSGEVTIHAVVLNNGTADADNVLVQFIDITSGTAVPLSLEQTIPFIEVGNSAFVEAKFELHSDRSRKIQVLVDSNNLIAESNEGDNEATKILTSATSPAPNLVILAENIGFEPLMPTTNEEVTIHAVILNNGDSPVENVEVDVVDVTTGRPSPLAQTQTIELIPAGGSGTVEVTYDTTGLVGDRKIRVIVDPSNFASESNETDNKATRSLSIAPLSQANLRIHDHNIGFSPPDPGHGDPVKITATILNEGLLDAEEVLVQFVDVTEGGMIPIDAKQIVSLIPAGGSATTSVTFDTTGYVGERKIQVLVDPHTNIPETNESDNQGTRALAIAPPPTPNLVVDKANIGFDQIEVVEGDTVVINATVINNGNRHAENIAVQFIDTTDSVPMPIGTDQAIGSILAGGSATVQVTYDTTNRTGDRKIQVIVDRNNLIFELSEGDNSATSELTVALQPAPNLMMDSANIGFDMVAPSEGDQVTINATVLNKGGVDADDVVVQFVDVTNRNSSPIGEPQVIDLIPGGGSGTTQITYDTTGLSGDRKIEVIIDPSNFVAESKESDNDATTTLEMTSPPAPNLTLDDDNIGFSPLSVRSGEEVMIRAVVLNNGDAEASDVTVQFLDVTDGALMPIGQIQNIDTVPAGGSGTVNVTYQTTGLLGEREIRVVVDPANFVAESKETDNDAEVELEIHPDHAPNLVALGANVGFNPLYPIEGDLVTIHAVILNDGTSDANDVVIQFVDVTDGGVMPIGQPQVIASISMGGSGAAQTTYDTTGKVGDRQIQVLVDPNSFITESNKEDNHATAHLSVAPPPAPNLVVLSGNVKFDPAQPEQGDTVSILISVLNDGNEAATDIVVQVLDVTSDEPSPVGAEQVIDELGAGSSASVEVILDDTDEAGERTIQVVVDPTDGVAESNEEDNETLKRLIIEPPAIPNLVVNASNIQISPARPVMGEPMSVTVDILNNGTDVAENFTVLIADVTDGGSEVIGEPQVISKLGMGESTTLVVDYDTNDKSGDRRIRVTLDTENVVEETNENDNQADKRFTIAAEPDAPADLANLILFASNIRFEPTSPSVGDVVTITVNVPNEGTVDAEDVVVRFVNNTDDAGEVIGDRMVTGTLPVGESGTVSMTLDTSDLEGEVVIQVIADPENAIPETNEEDNDASKTLRLRAAAEGESASTLGGAAGQPNLAVSPESIHFDAAATPDGSLRIAATVTNRGRADSGTVVVRFVDVTSSGVIPIGSPQPITYLAAGESSTVEIDYDLDVSIGDHSIQVVVDPANIIYESDESDNLAERNIFLLGPPTPEPLQAAVERE